jgi:hypothetical protein
MVTFTTLAESNRAEPLSEQVIPARRGQGRNERSEQRDRHRNRQQHRAARH